MYYNNEGRWTLEETNHLFIAPVGPNGDDRHFPGLQEYFGDNSYKWRDWSGVPDGTGTEEDMPQVSVTIVCYDTHFPTQQPTKQPTDQPTQQPTQQPSMAPTEICTALYVTVETTTVVCEDALDKDSCETPGHEHCEWLNSNNSPTGTEGCFDLNYNHDSVK